MRFTSGFSAIPLAVAALLMVLVALVGCQNGNGFADLPDRILVDGWYMLSKPELVPDGSFYYFNGPKLVARDASNQKVWEAPAWSTDDWLTPVFHEGVLYAAVGLGMTEPYQLPTSCELAAFNQTGARLWTVPLPGRPQGQLELAGEELYLPIQSFPVVLTDTLRQIPPAVQDQGDISAEVLVLMVFNLDGSERWRCSAHAAINGRCLAAPDQNRVYLTFGRRIVALDGDGTYLWDFIVDDGGYNYASLLYSSSALYVFSGHAVHVLNAQGEELWMYRPAQDGRRAFANTGGIAVEDTLGAISVLNLDGSPRCTCDSAADPLELVGICPDGSVYAMQTPAAGGNEYGKLRRYSSAGEFLWKAPHYFHFGWINIADNGNVFGIHMQPMENGGRQRFRILSGQGKVSSEIWAEEQYSIWMNTDPMAD